MSSLYGSISYFLIPEYTDQRISSISHIDLVRRGHAFYQSYSIKRPIDITSVKQEGLIPSRSLMSLSMLCEAPINCLYGHPVTDNVRSVTKHLTPHLGYIVVSGLRAVYTIITMRVTYDTLHNFACSTLIAGQSGINITPNISYTYVKT